MNTVKSKPKEDKSKFINPNNTNLNNTKPQSKNIEIKYHKDDTKPISMTMRLKLRERERERGLNWHHH